MAFHKILCPVDFSPGSQRAVAAAARLAGDQGELVLVHAWLMPTMGMTDQGVYPPEVIQGFVDEAQGGLDAAVVEAGKLGARKVTGRVVDGPAMQVVCDTAKADPAIDLIVVSTHGRTGVARAVMGSVAEEIVRHAPVPVLAVRLEGEPRRFGHVLCPIDFSPASRVAMALAGALAEAGGKGISLLHVGEPDQAAELTAWASELAARTKVAVTSVVRAGKPEAELLAVLEADPSIDLVVMGSRGRTGLARMALGSVAESIVRRAPCPVLVTHGAPVDPPA